MTPLMLRRATPADAAAITEIHVRSWQTAYRGMMDDAFLDALSIPQRTEVWRQRLESPQEELRAWVAEQDGVVVGFCAYGPDDADDLPPGTALLSMIYVLPELKRSGVGSALITQTERAMRDEGYQHAVLWLLKQNEKAAAFYDRMGWLPDGTEEEFDRLGQRTTEVRRRKAL